MPLHENTVNGLVYMTSPVIRTVHAFTTRLGGVSEGIYRSLNLGENSGDSKASLEQNYSHLCACLGLPPDRLVFSRQVHGGEVKRVTSADRHQLFSPIPYEADGLITSKPQLPLVVFIADCIPILLHDPKAGAVGAVHAGWRGTAVNIAGQAVRRMAEEFGSRPRDIRAAVGPGIGLCCFETGPEVPAALPSLPAAGELVREKPGGKFMVDLKGVNRFLLEAAGLLPEHIDVSDECTLCSHDRYWSHRFTGGRRGSQAALIMLKGQTP